MSEEAQFDKLKQKPLVLLSPLDWGSGHTTRCIPIIQHLLDLNCSVLIACNENQKYLLHPEFPSCEYVQLPGYGISYGHTAILTRIRLLFQIPRIWRCIREEKAWLNQLLRDHPISGVISDNRYGLYAEQLPCVLITHQLRIQSGSGTVIDDIIQKHHYRLIDRFTECWVPDTFEQPSAAGKLSHPSSMPATPTQYLGSLSRLNPCSPSIYKPRLLLILISGPEPQRSILEAILMKQLNGIKEQVVLIRGTRNKRLRGDVPSNVSIRDHVEVAELHKLICAAYLVIARSGYTTVMDLLKLKKQSILIPTPGQTEQEYLAKHLGRHGWALPVQQKDLDLSKALQKAASFEYKTVEWNMEQYKTVVKEWVGKLT